MPCWQLSCTTPAGTEKIAAIVSENSMEEAVVMDVIKDVIEVVAPVVIVAILTTKNQ